MSMENGSDDLRRVARRAVSARQLGSSLRRIRIDPSPEVLAFVRDNPDADLQFVPQPGTDSEQPGVRGGKACIDETRISVADVVVLLEQDLGDRQIVERYPALNLAQVHAAISYYYEHPEELAADLSEDANAETEHDRRKAEYLASPCGVRRSSPERRYPVQCLIWRSVLDIMMLQWSHHDVRTTLTLDDDVAAKLKAAARRSRRSFKATVNDALRRGLAEAPRKRGAPFRVAARDLGPLRPGLSLDNVWELIEQIEGPLHR